MAQLLLTIMLLRLKVLYNVEMRTTILAIFVFLLVMLKLIYIKILNSKEKNNNHLLLISVLSLHIKATLLISLVLTPIILVLTLVVYILRLHLL